MVYKSEVKIHVGPKLGTKGLLQRQMLFAKCGLNYVGHFLTYRSAENVFAVLKERRFSIFITH